MMGLVVLPSSVMVSLVAVAAMMSNERRVASKVWYLSPLAVMMIPIIRESALAGVAVRRYHWLPLVSERSAN